MCRRFYFLAPFAIIATLGLVGCSTKKDKVTELVQQGKYADANVLLSQLTLEDRLTPEIKFLSAKVSAGLLSDSALAFINAQEFRAGVLRLSDRLEEYSAFPQIQDSLRRQMIAWAFTGAAFFDRNGENVLAYNCFEPLGDITGLISQKQSTFLDRLTKAMLSGIWEGKSDKHKLHITMRLEALTPSSFTGRVFFKETYIMSELQDGFFDGAELSAAYPINVTRYSQTLEGIKGRYDNGTLIMSFPIVVTDAQSADYGGGFGGTSYYSHIVQETCVMRKTKGL